MLATRGRTPASFLTASTKWPRAHPRSFLLGPYGIMLTVILPQDCAWPWKAALTISYFSFHGLYRVALWLLCSQRAGNCSKHPQVEENGSVRGKDRSYCVEVDRVAVVEYEHCPMPTALRCLQPGLSYQGRSY